MTFQTGSKEFWIGSCDQLAADVIIHLRADSLEGLGLAEKRGEGGGRIADNGKTNQVQA